jgi:rhomboid protease GluP
MARCVACGAEVGSGGVVQADGAVVCAECDARAHKPIERVSAAPVTTFRENSREDGTQATQTGMSAPPSQIEAFTRSERPKFTAVATYSLIAINSAVFLWMTLSMKSLSPTANQLIKLGGNHGPHTLKEPWRLISSMFMHAGPVHFLSNMYVLMGLGILAEQVFGRRRFLLLYGLAGIGGTMLSLWWNPAVVGVGASGAIFGVAGALLAFFMQNRQMYDPHSFKKQINALLLFAGYNLFFGFAIPGIDNAAHIGGLLTGFLLGLLVSVTPFAIWREGAALALAACFFGAGFERLGWRIGQSKQVKAQSMILAFADYFTTAKELIAAQDSTMKVLSDQFLDKSAAKPRTSYVDDARENLAKLKAMTVDEELTELHGLIVKRAEAMLNLAEAMEKAPDGKYPVNARSAFEACQDATRNVNQKFSELERTAKSLK